MIAGERGPPGRSLARVGEDQFPIVVFFFFCDKVEPERKSRVPAVTVREWVTHSASSTTIRYGLRSVTDRGGWFSVTHRTLCTVVWTGRQGGRRFRIPGSQYGLRGLVPSAPLPSGRRGGARTLRQPGSSCSPRLAQHQWRIQPVT